MDWLLRKAVTFSLFLFVLILFKSTESSGSATFKQSIAIENRCEIKGSAIPAPPVIIPAFDNELISSGIFAPGQCNTMQNLILCTNLKTDHRLKFLAKRFTKIKPILFYLAQYPVEAALYGEDIPLIS